MSEHDRNLTIANALIQKQYIYVYFHFKLEFF